MKNQTSAFIKGGQVRASKSALPILRQQVEQEFAPSRPTSGWLRKAVFRWRLGREVKRRLSSVASDRSLY